MCHDPRSSGAANLVAHPVSVLFCSVSVSVHHLTRLTLTLFRLAAMLRQLAQYHAKDSNALFMVRLAQGLTHLGKGTLTLQPYHSERQLMNPVAVAGLLSTVVACLDVKNSNSFVVSLFSGARVLGCSAGLPVVRCIHFSSFICLMVIICCLLYSTLLYSHSEQVALPAVHTGGFPPAADAHHIRRGTATASRLCSSGTSC